MYKQLLFTYGFLIIALFLIITGCSKNNWEEEKEQAAISDTNDNPFEIDDEDTVILGSISHGFTNLEFDNNDEVIPLTYEGDDLVLDYFVKAEGKATNVGFLVYVDGIPQPYKFNTTDVDYQYMHILDVEDNEDTPFQFVFTPITGKKGKLLISRSPAYTILPLLQI